MQVIGTCKAIIIIPEMITLTVITKSTLEHENEKKFVSPMGKEGKTQVSSIIQLDDKST